MDAFAQAPTPSAKSLAQTVLFVRERFVGIGAQNVGAQAFAGGGQGAGGANAVRGQYGQGVMNVYGRTFQPGLYELGKSTGIKKDGYAMTEHSLQARRRVTTLNLAQRGFREDV